MSTIAETITSTFSNTQIQPDFDGAPKFESLTNDSMSSGTNGSCSTFCTSKGILTITGEQRLKFLQGQTTCDTSKISKEKASYGAFCNLKGRSIANFLAYDDGTSCHLIMHQGLITPLIDHLTKFAVFFRVTLTNNDQLLISGQLNIPSLELSPLLVESKDNQTHIQISPTRTLTVSSLDHFTATLITSPLCSEAVWNEKDLEEGIAWITPSTSEAFLPQLLGLEEIDGLSFSKGCYTGQEIIARMKYRGQLKRHLQLAQLTPKEGLEVNLPPGAKLNSQEKSNIGQVINLENRSQGFLALLSLEDDFTAINECLIEQKPFEINIMDIKRA
ncbi:YgfZ/GcvT domain-containing protein [Litoribrevibacter euphylliae]|uniref:YgfZ/GcvT domain-containing protein n=1 Tax=Litoribrevibacter euphylliae TaxID=1834034 RepID=A0ABV7H6N5_9GAMM